MTRELKYWKLPQIIDVKEGKEWSSIPKMARVIPFGYKQSEEDSDLLLPIPEQLDMLEQAKKYTKQYSWREIANWLSSSTGRTISHEGLRKRLKNERQRKNKVKSLRQWAEYAEKTINKAKEIESKRTGAISDRAIT